VAQAWEHSAVSAFDWAGATVKEFKARLAELDAALDRKMSPLELQRVGQELHELGQALPTREFYEQLHDRYKDVDKKASAKLKI
jgi:Sec-independent protein translocase protein TatA